MKNISEIVSLNASRYPENIAIVYKDQRFSYRELNNRINRLANHLLDLGITKGDRVGFIFYNSNQYVEMFYATVRIGAIAVPINFRNIPREIKWVVDHSRCKVLAYGENCSQQVDPIKKDLPTVEHLIYAGSNCPNGEFNFEEFASKGNSNPPNVQVDFEDPAVILHTGGTTGFPKGAVHTHRSTLFSNLNVLMGMHMSAPEEVVCMQIPMFHIAGLIFLNNIMTIGGKLVIVENFEPVEILRLIDQERVTCLSLLPPATYIRLMDAPNIKEFDTSSVLRLQTAAGVLPKSIILRLFDTFPNTSITYGYGLTEAFSGCISWIDRTKVEQDVESIKGVGIPFPLLEIKLVDEQGQEVPLGETGEVIIKSPTVMQGYFEQPELTAQALKDGWLYTGDLFKKDKDGIFYFVDRKKDMIKSGGENVFAQEVEGVILSHPAVEMCAVFGIPDVKFGEAVVAVAKLRPGFTATEEEIIEHCKNYLSSYKKPRQIFFLDSFPVSDAGKVQKFKLREQYSKKEE